MAVRKMQALIALPVLERAATPSRCPPFAPFSSSSCTRLRTSRALPLKRSNVPTMRPPPGGRSRGSTKPHGSSVRTTHDGHRGRADVANHIYAHPPL